MAQRILYLDPWSGLSGDMILAALLDAGRDRPELETTFHTAIGSLGLPGVRVEVSRGLEWGVACTRVRVSDEEAPPLRHLADMAGIIERAALSDRVRKRSLEAVTHLAEAEARVHGCAIDQVHFHEVGAADTIVDVVGTFVLVEALAIEGVHVGDIPVGGGAVQIAHGRIGVPAPATTLLLEGYRVFGGPEMKELTTPTGALLVARLGATQGVLPRMTVERTGYGAGTMKLNGGPNLLRAVLGAVDPGEQDGGCAGSADENDVVVELVTNLDDVSPETVGHVVGRLRGEGALDVWTVPAHMKKDRPGVVLHALVPIDGETRAVDAIFSETGTLGVRRRSWERYLAHRGVLTVTVDGAAVRVKWGRRHGTVVNVAPEHDDAAAAALAQGRPLREVVRLAEQAARAALEAADREG